MSDSRTQHSVPSRRWLWWVNLVLGMLAVLALAGMANYFSHRHNYRAYWAQRLDNELSPLTLQVLQSVENPVRVVVFYDRRESLYRPIIELLRQYEEQNPLLEVESVDYELEPAKASHIQSELRLPGNARDLVIFHANQKTKVVPHGALSGLSATQRDEHGRMVFKRIRFNGEQMFTSALVAVVKKPAKVYYLAEHGTHSFTNTATLDGYGRFSRSLARMNVNLQPLSLSEKAVPPDCGLLIVPGPRNQLDALSLSRLRDHLTAGGRQLILFRPHTRAGLEPLLADWGVLVGNDEVNDPGNSYGDGSVKFSKYDWDKERGLYHPVMRALAQGQMSVRMYKPRSVTDLKSSPVGGETVRRTVLASTGPQGLTYLRPAPGMSPNLRRVGLRGYIPVAMAVERDPPPGVENEENDKTVRLIVMGDSAWLNNGLYDREANAQLAWHLINWMLDQSHLLKIGPRPITDHQFSLTENNRRDLMGWLLGVVPGSILGLGLLVWLRRRH